MHFSLQSAAYDTQLSGTIPSEIGLAANISEITFKNADLSGSIPSEMANLQGLFYLWLVGHYAAGHYAA
jgi:hypothetical protein